MEDVALVIRVTSDDVVHLEDQLTHVERLRETGPAQVLALVDEASYPSVADAHAERAGIEILVLPEGGSATWWDLITRHVQSPFVAAVRIASLGGQWSVDQIRRELPSARAAAQRVLAHTDQPVLLATRWCAQDIARDYVDHVLAGRSSGPVVAHAGWVALSAGHIVAEGVDPRPGAMRVQVLLDLPVSRSIPWRFAVAVVKPDGFIVESEPVVTRRFDVRTGALHRHRIEVEVPLMQVPDGTYMLGMRLHSEAGAVAGVRPLAPSAGSTACARTVSTTGVDGEQDQRLRYLIHPKGGGTRLGITVQHGGGRVAAARWRTRKLRADVTQVLHGPGGRRVRMLGLIRLLTMPLFARRRPYLIGERPGVAEDNGLHLFRHLRDLAPHRPVYFILDHDGAQDSELRTLGHVVPHSSWHHRLLMLHAEVLAGSHSLRYLIPRGWPVGDYQRNLAWRIGSIRVFLQHGIHLSPGSLNRRTTGYDVIITSAHDETDALRQVTGYTHQVVEAGMPRFDTLVSHSSTRTILVMTTWRRYLPSPVSTPAAEPFSGSAYERFITELLRSDRLNEVLSVHDYRLRVVPHVNIAGAMEGMEATHERMSIETEPTQSVHEMLLDCDALITDYSSVHFDAAYMGKPVIYARFDEEEYETKHADPSWFDFERAGFGPVVHSVDDVISQVGSLLARDSVRDSVYTERAEWFFGEVDWHNTERVVQVIDDLVATSRRALR